jgi:hypothetical protein
MPICFWNLCHCPDAQPCTEHTGTGCSIVNGQPITDPSQVDDAVTRAGEVAIGKITGDMQRADAIVRQLEARKAELERERDDFERESRDADSYSKRRALIQRERDIARRNEKLGDELTALAEELHALGNSAQVAVAPLSNALQIPFSDPTGYCTCYQAKVAQLQALAAQIAAEQVTLGAATTAYNAARAVVIPKLKITFSIASVVFLAIFLLLGGAVGAVIGAFVALLFTAVTVVGLAVQLGMRRAAVLRSRARLYALWLSYYRLQTIPTCVRSVDQCHEGDDDTECDREDPFCPPAPHEERGPPRDH